VTHLCSVNLITFTTCLVLRYYKLDAAQNEVALLIHMYQFYMGIRSFIALATIDRLSRNVCNKPPMLRSTTEELSSQVHRVVARNYAQLAADYSMTPLGGHL
jgi:hypothetical protein